VNKEQALTMCIVVYIGALALFALIGAQLHFAAVASLAKLMFIVLLMAVVALILISAVILMGFTLYHMVIFIVRNLVKLMETF